MEDAAGTLALAGAPVVAAGLLELATTRRDPVAAGRLRLRRDALLKGLEEVRTLLLGALGTGGLTLREREVVVLAAGGLPSRAIAEQLSLSVRTVDNHLGRAYAKLGVSDRRGLTAVWPR